MKDIALSALKRFRQWLSDLALHQNNTSEYKALMRDIRQSGVMAGRNFSREEMNER
jgi:hypothetical protein